MPVAARPAADVPEHPGRHVVPRAAGHDADALPDRRHASRWCAAPTACGPAASGSAIDALFDLGVFQEGRIELVEDFADLRSQRRRPRRRRRPAVRGDAAQRQAGSGAGDPRRRQRPRRVLRPGRLARPARPDAEPRAALRGRTPTSRTSAASTRSTRSCSRSCRATRKRDRNNFGPRIGFNWAPGDGRTSVHGGYGIYYDRITLQIQSLERGLDGRALPIEVRAGNVFFLDPNTGQFPPFAPSIANPFTGFILTGAGRLGHQHHRQHDAEPERAAVEPRRRAGPAARRRAARRRRPQPRHALHHRPHDRRGLQPGGRRPRSRRQPRVEREHALRRAARQRRAARRRRRVPRLVHVRQGAQLRQRRPDPVRQRADRSDQPAARVRPDAERPAAPLHAGGVGAGAGRVPGRADRDAGVRRADGHPDAGRARRASRSSSATPAAGSSGPAPS